MPTRCVIYARISVKSKESVSIKRQVEAAQHYAAARGWQVVEIFKDDGVSATHNSPEDRAGWSALLASEKQFDVVIIWKIDRLARRISDFWSSCQRLDGQGRSLVSVEDNLDMTTTIGQIVAGVIAGFAQMEAEAISDRVKGARSYLIANGRSVGGRVTYGWRTAPNPDGAGYVLAQDPDKIDIVRGMVERIQHGGSIYSVQRWLEETEAPTPGWRGVPFVQQPWLYNTVEKLLRNPVLAGMTSSNPGADPKAKVRGDDVRRDENGLPHVEEALAIMTTESWRSMVLALDNRDSAQTRPRALCSKTSGLLSGLVRCGNHPDDDGAGTRMHRGTTQGRQGYICPACHMTITNFEDVVIAEFLRQKGERTRWSRVETVHEGGQALLPEIEARLNELDVAIRASKGKARRALQDQQSDLLDLRDEKRTETPAVTHRWVGDTTTFAEAWEAAGDVMARRAVLDDALTAVRVVRGRTGRRTEAGILARLSFDWKGSDLGPLETPDDATLAAWG